jgi:hypothetical protein
MSIMLPEPLGTWILPLLGIMWPAADEDKMRQVGDAYRQYATDIRDLASQADQVVTGQLLDGNQGQAFDALQQRWAQLSDGNGGGLLGTAADDAETIAGVFDIAADIVVAIKIIMIIQMIELATELLTDQAAAPETFGASEAVAAGEIMVQRVLMQRLVAFARNAIVGMIKFALQQAVINGVVAILGNIISQGVEMQFGMSQGVDMGAALSAGVTTAGQTFISNFDSPQAIGMALTGPLVHGGIHGDLLGDNHGYVPLQDTSGGEPSADTVLTSASVHPEGASDNTGTPQDPTSSQGPASPDTSPAPLDAGAAPFTGPEPELTPFDPAAVTDQPPPETTSGPLAEPPDSAGGASPADTSPADTPGQAAPPTSESTVTSGDGSNQVTISHDPASTGTSVTPNDYSPNDYSTGTPPVAATPPSPDVTEQNYAPAPSQEPVMPGSAPDSPSGLNHIAAELNGDGQPAPATTQLAAAVSYPRADLTAPPSFTDGLRESRPFQQADHTLGAQPQSDPGYVQPMPPEDRAAPTRPSEDRAGSTTPSEDRAAPATASPFEDQHTASAGEPPPAVHPYDGGAYIAGPQDPITAGNMQRIRVDGAFVLEGHAAEGDLFPDGPIDFGSVTPEELRAIGWDGKSPVVLAVCEVQTGDAASRLAMRLGVPVIAVDTAVWRTPGGELLAAGIEQSGDGMPRPDLASPGTWTVNEPDGTARPLAAEDNIHIPAPAIDNLSELVPLLRKGMIQGDGPIFIDTATDGPGDVNPQNGDVIIRSATPGTPPKILEIGAGPPREGGGTHYLPNRAEALDTIQVTPKVSPMSGDEEPIYAELTRTDLAQPGRYELNAVTPMPDSIGASAVQVDRSSGSVTMSQGVIEDFVGVKDQMDAVVITNPHGYTPDIATVGQAVREGGLLIFQGRGPVNRDFAPLWSDVQNGRIPPGYELLDAHQWNAPGGPPDPASLMARKPAEVIGDGPFRSTDPAARRPYLEWPNQRIVLRKIAAGPDLSEGGSAISADPASSPGPESPDSGAAPLNAGSTRHHVDDQGNLSDDQGTPPAGQPASSPLAPDDDHLAGWPTDRLATARLSPDVSQVPTAPLPASDEITAKRAAIPSPPHDKTARTDLAALQAHDPEPAVTGRRNTIAEALNGRPEQDQPAATPAREAELAQGPRAGQLTQEPDLAAGFAELSAHGIVPRVVTTDMIEGEYGILEHNQKMFHAMADRYHVVFDVRPSNPESIDLLRQGAVPKPEAIKAKTINEIDARLAPNEMRETLHRMVGAVGLFDPVPPVREPGESAASWVQVQKRYQQRHDEYAELKPKLDHLEEDGKFKVRSGVVYPFDPVATREATGDYPTLYVGHNGQAFVLDPAGNPVTPVSDLPPVGEYGPPVAGDHDIFNIRDLSGRPLAEVLELTDSDTLERVRMFIFRDSDGSVLDIRPDSRLDVWYTKLVNEAARGPGQTRDIPPEAGELLWRGLGVRHGAHMEWTPKNDFEQKIYDKIVAGHQQGGEPLVRFRPGRPPMLVWADTPLTADTSRQLMAPVSDAAGGTAGETGAPVVTYGEET